MIFGARLKACRERLGWTKQVLADRAGVPYMTIYRLETDDHQNVSLLMAVKLARALNTSVDWLADTYGESRREDAAVPPTRRAASHS